MGASKWLKIEATEHQVAIAGCVVDAVTKSVLPGVTVELTSAPDAFQALLSAWSLARDGGFRADADRPDRTTTAADGVFRFADLPDGAYEISFVTTRYSEQYGHVRKQVVVARGQDGRIDAPLMRVELPPTGVRGRVVAVVEGDTVPLVMARVRLSAGDRPAYTDGEGKFALTGVFPGQYRCLIAARGYAPATATLDLARGQILDADDFILESESL